MTVYRVIWLVEGHLAYGSMWGKWTSADVHDFDKTVLEMMDTARSTAPLVHAIYDHSRIEKLPALKDYLSLQASKHPHAGWVLVVGLDTSATKFIISTATQLLKMRLRFFDTVDAALSFIQYIDETMPPMDKAAIHAQIAEMNAEITGASHPSDG